MIRTKRRLGFNARYLRDFYLRGFNRYTLCLLKELANRGDFEIFLITDQRSPVHPEFTKLVEAKVLEVPSISALFWEQWSLPLAIHDHRISLFHAPADGGLPVWKRCPLVLTYHRALDKSIQRSISLGDLPGPYSNYLPGTEGLRGRYYQARHSLLRSLYLHAADTIIAVSEFGRRELVELLGVPGERVRVIYEAADEQFSSNISDDVVSKVRAKYGIPDHYFLFVGG